MMGYDTSSSTEKVAFRFLQAPHHDLWIINMIGLKYIKAKLLLCALDFYSENYFDSSSATESAASREGCQEYSSPHPLDRSVTSDVRDEVRRKRRRMGSMVRPTAETGRHPVYYVLISAA